MKLALERRVTRRIRSTPGPLVPRFTASVAIADRRFAVPRRFPRRAPTSSRRFLRSGERLRRSRRVSPPPTSPARTRGGGRHTLARSNADRARARAPRPRRARARASRAARLEAPSRDPRRARRPRSVRISASRLANRRARGWRAVRERRATVRERPRRPRASPRDASRERPRAALAPRRAASLGAAPAPPRAPPHASPPRGGSRRIGRRVVVALARARPVGVEPRAAVPSPRRAPARLSSPGSPPRASPLPARRGPAPPRVINDDPPRRAVGGRRRRARRRGRAPGRHRRGRARRRHPRRPARRSPRTRRTGASRRSSSSARSKPRETRAPASSSAPEEASPLRPRRGGRFRFAGFRRLRERDRNRARAADVRRDVRTTVGRRLPNRPEDFGRLFRRRGVVSERRRRHRLSASGSWRRWRPWASPRRQLVREPLLSSAETACAAKMGVLYLAALAEHEPLRVRRRDVLRGERRRHHRRREGGRRGGGGKEKRLRGGGDVVGRRRGGGARRRRSMSAARRRRLLAAVFAIAAAPSSPSCTSPRRTRRCARTSRSAPWAFLLRRRRRRRGRLRGGRGATPMRAWVAGRRVAAALVLASHPSALGPASRPRARSRRPGAHAPAVLARDATQGVVRPTRGGRGPGEGRDERVENDERRCGGVCGVGVVFVARGSRSRPRARLIRLERRS